MSTVGQMIFKQIKDPRLAQYAYIVGSRSTSEALLIDPERDVDRYVAAAEAEGLRITAVAETHIHADFLSGARELAERYGAKVYLSGEGGPDWQPRWIDSGQYDVDLLRDGSTFRVGEVVVRAVHTPGHTPEHLTFLLRDLAAGSAAPTRAITGDFVFVGDLGRPDLLETAAGVAGVMDASARALFRSVQASMAWPDDLEIWPGHGAGSSCGKSLGAAPKTTWRAEKETSPALRAAAGGEESFVDFILDAQPEPPLYFARMKRLNRDGVPLLGELPRPPRVTVDELMASTGRSGVTVLDTRPDRLEYAAGHLPGSLHAPLDELFHTVVGSYVDPESSIHLVAEEPDVVDLVQDLVRIGFDRIGGWLEPEAVGAFGRSGGALDSIEVIDFRDLAVRVGEPGTHVLDVRSANEVEDGRGVSGALNVAHTRLWDRVDDIPSGGEVAVYCGTGRRAARAASLLQREGRRVVLVNDELGRWDPGADHPSSPVAA